jgi:hypothetical protein
MKTYLHAFGFVLFLLNSVLLSASPTPEKTVCFGGIFQGEINNKLGIVMRLSCQNGKITGNYFYTSVKAKIRLEGNLKEEILTFSEYTPQGTATGTFSGKLSKQENSYQITGTWSSADGKRKLPFTVNAQFLKLTTVADCQTGKYNFKRYSRVLLEEKDVKMSADDKESLSGVYMPEFTSLIRYQQIEGLSNSKVQQILNKELLPLQLTDSLFDISLPDKKGVTNWGGNSETTNEIDFFYNSVITFSSFSYTFEAGAAHGMDGYTASSYNLDNGTTFTNLDSFFKGNYTSQMNNWLKKNFQCWDMLENEKKSCVNILSANKNELGFWITNNAINFSLENSCDFPYVARTCNFIEIPLSELKQNIIAGSPLAGIVK